MVSLFLHSGGTKRVADILVNNLGGGFCNVDICRDIESMTLHADDVCLVSVPSFAGRVPQIAVERLKKITGVLRAITAVTDLLCHAEQRSVAVLPNSED